MVYDFVYSVLFLLFLYVFAIPFLLKPHKLVNVPNHFHQLAAYFLLFFLQISLL